MSAPILTREEVMASHAYARPQVEAGYRLHGGFDADERYHSPRTRNRWPAVRAWSEAVAARGWPLVDASPTLLSRGAYPNARQQTLLLGWGMGRTLWNSLTITGIIEARGAVLTQLPCPDMQAVIVEDIAATCTGHLAKGLLVAHGMDEAGDPAAGEGGHDVMWFAARDLLLGANAYPLPDPPGAVECPEQVRRMPQIPPEHERLILLLMNVLMVEVRAEMAFRFYIGLARAPHLFTDRRAEADQAATLIERIREDEAIHVAYLQATISEMRSFNFRTVDGGTVAGAALIDPVWQGMVQYHAVQVLAEQRRLTREAIVARLAALPDGPARIAQFDAAEQDA